MPYEPDTTDDLFEQVTDRHLTINPDANPKVQSTLLYASHRTLAQTLAENQEQNLKEVYDSGFIENATGDDLTKKARNLGFIRNDPVPATGVVTFKRETRASRDYKIPAGTVVETVSEDPVQFETENTQTLKGPVSKVDETTYNNTSTSYGLYSLLSEDVTKHDTITVKGEFRISDPSETASVRVKDNTNSKTINTFTTSNILYETFTDTYDTTNLSGDILFTFELKSSDSSTSVTADLRNSEIETDGQKSVSANVVAVEASSDGNVGPRSVQVLPSPPTGIETVVNEEAIGDPTNTDLNGDPLVTGRDEENDEELRERVRETDTTREGPDPDGVEFALENIDGVLSVSMRTNQKSGVNNGLDPYHSELIILGGTARKIAETLYDVMSVSTLQRLQSVNGTTDTYELEADLLDQTITVPISRPSEVGIEMFLDVVHTEQYAGDDSVKDEIVEYIGGRQTDGTRQIGKVDGENVLINEVENRVEDLNGVEYADVTLADMDSDNYSDITVDSDGVPVLSIGTTEVAQIDSTDITVNTTAR